MLRVLEVEECPGMGVLEKNSVLAELIPLRTIRTKGDENWEKLKSYLNSKTEDGETVSEKYCVR